MTREQARALARKNGNWTVSEIEAIDQFLGTLYEERDCGIFTSSEIGKLIEGASEDVRKTLQVEGYCTCGAFKEDKANPGLFEIARIAEGVRVYVKMPMTYCPACGRKREIFKEEMKK